MVCGYGLNNGILDVDNGITDDDDDDDDDTFCHVYFLSTSVVCFVFD